MQLTVDEGPQREHTVQDPTEGQLNIPGTLCIRDIFIIYFLS